MSADEVVRVHRNIILPLPHQSGLRHLLTARNGEDLSSRFRLVAVYTRHALLDSGHQGDKQACAAFIWLTCSTREPPRLHALFIGKRSR
jgi:hypothetical protein